MDDNFGRPFFRSMVSGKDGSVSTTRVCILIVFSFVVGLGVAIVTKIHAPVSVSEFCQFLGAAGTFIVTVTGPLYLINKGSGVFRGKSDSNDPTPEK